MKRKGVYRAGFVQLSAKTKKEREPKPALKMFE